MSDNSDVSESPIIAKGKRKPAVLTDSDRESESSTSDLDAPALRRNGKRKNRIRDSESNSDSSIEKPRKMKRVPRVKTDSEGSSRRARTGSEGSTSDDSEIGRTKKITRMVIAESPVSESDPNLSGASDNGFETDSTSDDWESDWVSESEMETSVPSVNTTAETASDPVAVSFVPADYSDSSSDNEREKCPICFLTFKEQEVGTPETCDHSFCAECIQEWSKNVNTCPVDRQTFTLILVRKRYNEKVIRRVPVDIRRQSLDELFQEDPTYCEICGMSDREDRLLLCDGCDLGYHLECLEPPMDAVPIDEWFCTECRNPQQNQSRTEHVSHTRRLRNEPRLLPRTSQSERIRATIEINRHNATLTTDHQSVSSGFEDTAQPGPSRTSSNNSTTVFRNRSTAPTRSRRKVKSKRKSKPRYVTTYEICETTGEKIKIMTRVHPRRKKKRKYKSRRRRRVIVPQTVKKRLAFQLGMCPPKKAGLVIPEVKVKANTSNTGHLGNQRSQAGIPTLHLFGQRDQLDYFSGSDEEITSSIPSRSGNVLTQVRSLGNRNTVRRAARAKAALLAPTPAAPVNSCDILGSILDSQTKLHSKHSVISVSHDGTVHIENNRVSKKDSKSNNNNDILKPDNNTLPSENPIDLTSSRDIEATQTPMFGRGGGGNRQPYGFQRGGYRGGNDRYDGGGSGGGGYNNFHSSGPRGQHGGRGGFGFGQQRENFGGGVFMNFRHGGPPPPFRGRGGPRFPNRRPNYQQNNQPPPNQFQNETPLDFALDEPIEYPAEQVQDLSRQVEQDDVDIYSDIEDNAQAPEEDVHVKVPVSESNPTLVSQAYNNSGSEDDSGSELIIDDTVKENEKYDPTQPSADTDSNSEELTHDLKESENVDPPTEELENLTTEDKPLLEETEAPKMSTSNQISQQVHQAVQEVMKEHHQKNFAEDEASDEDCPNFSIYSSTSLDIAKSTDLSVNIPITEEESNETQNLLEEQCEESAQSVVQNITQYQDDEDSWGAADDWEPCDAENAQKSWDTAEPVKIILPSEASKQSSTDNNDIPWEKEILSEKEIPSEKEILLEKEISSNDTLQEDKSDNEISPSEDASEVDNKEREEIEHMEPLEEIPIPHKEPVEEIPIPHKEPVEENFELVEENLESVEKSSISEKEDEEVSEEKESSDAIVTVQNSEENDDQDKTPKPDAPIESVASLLPPSTISIPVEQIPKVTAPLKIAFNTSRKLVIQSTTTLTKNTMTKKERVLQLYDDSDWEEWESKNEVDKGSKSAEEGEKNTSAETEKLTEAVSEEERSYTPCLDEKEPSKGHLSDEEHNMGGGIGGMDTEMISDDERNDIFDESHDMKTISDGDALEINAKESELDIVRPEDYEEGEIVEKVLTQSTQEAPPIEKPKVPESDDEKKKRAPRKKPEKETVDKEKHKDSTRDNDKQNQKKSEFKKISRSNKDRNYRDKERAKSRSKDRRGKDSSNKENRRAERTRKERKRDLERYNVRSIISEKPKKDQFGRDIKSPSRSSRSATPRRSRSLSWNRAKKRRRRSRSGGRRSKSRSISRGHTPRSRSRGRSPRRSRSARRSRSFRRSRTPRNKRFRVDYKSVSRDRDRTRYRNRSPKRSKKKNRSVSRSRIRTQSPSPPKHRIRSEWGRQNEMQQSFTREWTPSWSHSPTSPRPIPRHNLPQSMSPSWTPPLMDKGPVQPENLTVILTNNEVTKSKKKDKRKKIDKKSKDEYRKRKRADRTPPPSKEVFASGDNILVSVSFNKTGEENTIATREVMGVKRKRDELKKKKGGEKKKKRAKSPRTKKKNKEIANLKPVAIIDLDRSPFKEITPSPKDVIILSDSDNCEKEDESTLRMVHHHNMLQEELMAMDAQALEDSAPQSPTASYLNSSTGPKTPPEPQIKFLLTSKQTQLRAINNPLHDPNDEQEVEEIDPQEELEHRLDDILHKGPNTPPEPPSSPPSSPDAYDPFDPTKSRSPTPEPATNAQQISSGLGTPGDKTVSDGDLVDLAVGPLESSQKTIGPLNDSGEKAAGVLDRAKRLSSSPDHSTQSRTPPQSTTDTTTEPTEASKNDSKEKSPERNIIGVVINQQVQPQYPTVVKPIITTPVVTSTPISSVSLPRTNIFTSVAQRIILPTPSKASPAKMSPLKTSPSKPPIKSTPIKPMPSKTMISKLPVPNMKPLTPIRKNIAPKNTNRNVGQNGNEVIDVDLDFESPYSPGSSDYEDLFEPPVETKKPTKTTKSPAKQNTFDNLFGSTSPVFKSKSKSKAGKMPVKMNKKQASKGSTKTVGVKIDEDHLKILDDLPNSAVEMQVKDKFLKKLNRQERVVEEVKLVLKPHYNKKHISKEQYKDILRRAVPKICHNRSGEINPKKIQNLIEAYVRKSRQHKKLNTNQNSGTNPAPNKPAKTAFWS